MLGGTEAGWTCPSTPRCTEPHKEGEHGGNKEEGQNSPQGEWGQTHLAFLGSSDPQENQCRKGFIQLALGAAGTVLRASRGHLAVLGGLVVLAAPTRTQGEAMAAVAMEGAVAVVADVVAGARLCLALIYICERRREGQSCAKGTGLIKGTWMGCSGAG